VVPVLALVAALALALALRSRQPGGSPETPAGDGFLTFHGEAMATTVEVVLPAGERAEEAATAVIDLVREVEAEMSEWQEGSPLAAVNRAAGGAPVPVPARLQALLQRSLEIAEATDGAFDVTWAALWGVWDFRATDPELPAPGEVARRAALVDYRRLEIDLRAGTVRLPRPGMMVGLGGIAKGYALDRSAELLVERGYRDFMVVLGGQVLARGSRGERPWRVGIRHPRGEPQEYFATIDVRDAALSTSGDYEAFFERGGVRYHHILDPRTGWPASGVQSATVISADATLADALSTALVVLPPGRGLEIAHQLGVEVVVVDAEGQLHMTPAVPLRLVERPG
jgi:FAD:protein FMN transferase